ncbi:MAG: glycosyltransferase family 39 protein [Chloroflexi bacterium]|nr:glycosyltransferase family 39 protein [Chloroflexota bacterium]
MIAWGLLLWQLDSRSLWVDEFLTAQMIQGAPQDVVAAATRDIHPPLYFLLLNAWVQVSGASDFALRFPSVLAAMCALALMPVLARRTLGSSSALPATLLLAGAPAFVEFGRMARYYSLLLALAMLSTLLLLSAIKEDRVKLWIAYSLVGLALIYTFYPSAALPIAQGATLVWPSGGSHVLRRWAFAATLIVAGFLPWVWLSAGQQVASVATYTGVDFARTLVGFLLGIASAAYTFSVGETLFPWQPAALIGLFVVALVLGTGLFKRPAAMTWKFIGLCGINIVLMSAVTTYVATGTPFLNVPVRALFALPFFLLSLLACLMGVGSRVRRGLLGAILLSVSAVSNVNDFTGQQFPNPIYLTPSKEAAAYVRERVNRDDLVISDYDSVFGYYFVSNDATARQHRYTEPDSEVTVALASLRPARVWFITIGRDQSQSRSSANAVRLQLTDGYRLEHVERLLPIDPVYLRLKSAVLGRDTYAYRLTIELYTRP